MQPCEACDGAGDVAVYDDKRGKKIEPCEECNGKGFLYDYEQDENGDE